MSRPSSQPSSASAVHAAAVGDGVVPVAHLDSCQRHVYHLAVGSVLFGHNPVATVQHVVGRKLHRGYQAQDGVFEHQHQYSSRGAESRYDCHGRTPDEYADANNYTQADNYQLDHLENPLDGVEFISLSVGQGVVKIADKYGDNAYGGPDDIERRDSRKPVECRGVAAEKAGKYPAYHDGRRELRHGLEQTHVDQVVVPVGRTA